MSTLKVNQIRTKLRTMFEADLDLSDIGINDSERDNKVLTRCLAAFAVYLQSGCTEKEAAASVWDGADDNGIDAAYFDVSDSRVIFVQSKWINKGSGEPEAKEIGAFLKGVEDAVEQDATGFHSRLQARFSDLALRLAVPGTSVHMVLVTTGASHISRHGNKLIEGFLAELNGEDPEGIASSETLGLSEVYSGLVNDPLQGNLTLDATLLEWSYVATPYPAYFGMVDGLQLKEWWKKYGKRLVSGNIRHSLGVTEVNNQIRQTAANNPENFWYFNNGITLVADEATKAPSGAASHSAGIFAFKRASIVNGAQTVSSLSKVTDDNNLGKVRVAAKIILLKQAPPGFGNEVTRTNNLQNRIEPRDFAAQDPEQTRLRQEMAIEGIDYQFVRSDDANISATACELVEVTTALACASGDPNLAVQLKTGIGRFFADLTKPPYKAIFNPTVSGARAFNATVVQRQADGWIERKKRTLPKKSGPMWGVLVHGNRILATAVFSKFGAAPLEQPIAAFAGSFNQATLDAICDSAYGKMVKELEAHYAGKFLGVLFKNPRMSTAVFKAAVQ